jgi:hypothetical protein
MRTAAFGVRRRRVARFSGLQGHRRGLALTNRHLPRHDTLCSDRSLSSNWAADDARTNGWWDVEP